ncbi:MAG: hypothetical protein AAFQ98_03880 [Bacteroidota bacterium]
MPYKKFVVIGYNELTSSLPKALNPTLTSHDTERKDQVINYTWLDKLEDAELRAQALHMCRVITYAFDLLKSKKETQRRDVLKLFVAPEFLFNRIEKGKAPFNSYTRLEKDHLFIVLTQLLNTKALADWVIVPGTAIWRFKLPVPITKPELKEYAGMNTGAIISGGEGVLRTCTKKFASDADGIQGYWPQELLSKHDKRQIYEDWDELVLQKKGFDFGLEICRDHSFSFMVLKNLTKSTLKEYRKHTSSLKLDFHILSACSMGLNAPAVAAIPKGYVVRIDGALEAKPRMEVHQVKSQSLEDAQLYRQEEEWYEKKRIERQKTNTKKLKKEEEERRYVRMRTYRPEYYSEDVKWGTTLGGAATLATEALPKELHMREPTHSKAESGLRSAVFNISGLLDLPKH